jgi:hypothetical protein
MELRWGARGKRPKNRRKEKGVLLFYHPICCEWEFGGLSYWLLNKVPTSEFWKSGAKWLAEVDKWLTLLATKVAPGHDHTCGLYNVLVYSFSL